MRALASNLEAAGRGRAARGVAKVALLALAALVLATDASAWWNTSWSHRRKLTFDNSTQPVNLNNVPVLVVLNSARINYALTKNDGSDLRFVDGDDATLLDHEIEKWDESGNSYVWVRIPQVPASSSSDFIWIYYGNAAAAALPLANQQATWMASYSMVLHFDEAAPGAHLDSTTNGNNSSAIDVQTQASPTGQIDGADVFASASTDNIDVPDSATLDMGATDSFTVEAWIKTSSSAQQMVVSKENGSQEFQLWVDGGVASFWVNDGNDFARVSASGPTVDDGLWHYLVGRWSDGSSTAEIFVDGASQGAVINGAVDSLATATPLVIGEEGDANRGFNFTGTIDEVRIRKTSGSVDDWIYAQFLTQSDTGAGLAGPFVSYGPEAAQCCGLAVTETSTEIFVNGPNRFDMRFFRNTGGGIDRFVDAEENTGVDLAGGITFQEAYFTHEVSNGAQNYATGDTDEGVRLDLLEATLARVKVRQEANYARPGMTPPAMAGIKGFGDYSIYGIGRMAIAWETRATADVTSNFTQHQFSVSYQGFAPFNAWTGFSSSFGPVATPFAGNRGPASDSFVMAQIELPNARTDFLNIVSQPWALANNTYFGSQLGNEWQEVSWIDDEPTTFFNGTSTRWSYLSYFKPTNLVDRFDANVTARAIDYQGPDALSINLGKGSRWSEASENTAGAGDWFNEAEAAYVLDLDPALGLDFDIDGTAVLPRYRPFFKIRQWRSFSETPVVTVEGAALTKGTDYRAAVKPFARAHFEKDLTWYSPLEGTSHVSSPQVGTGNACPGAGCPGMDFPGIPPYRHGYNARFDSDGEYFSIPTAGNFSSAEGTIDFWYLPFYEYGTGVATDDMGLFGYAIDASNYFYAYHEPYAGAGAGTDEGLCFDVNAAGTVYSTCLGAHPTNHPVRWRANQWVHLRFVWKSAPGSRLEIWIDGRYVSPAPTGSYPVAVAMPANMYVGDRQTGGFVNNALGRIDEFRIYNSATGVTELARGGLTADAREQLGDPADDYTFTFAQEDANHRGEYLWFGADAKFRGINVNLDTAGAGVGLDLEWHYWDGFSWQDLEVTPGFTDQTANLTIAKGTIFWTSDPTNWAPYSLGGGPDLYYVRARLKTGAYSTQFPRENVIKTDILLFQHCHDVTAAATTFAFAVPPTTEVTLASFTATPGDASVRLDWRTASELRNLGFHLYRGPSADGPWQRLTSSLIPGLGSSAVGQAYSFRDDGLVNGTRYFYRLEDLDASGVVASHGPVSAVPVAGIAADDPASGGGTRDKRKDASASSCPAWVLQAYASSAGADAVTASLRCTRRGDPEATSFSVLSRDTRQATVELATGGFYALHEPSGGVRVYVPGFDLAQDGSALALPVRRALVDAVVGRQVALGGVRALEVVSFQGLMPSALGKAEMQVGRDGTVRAARRAARPPDVRGLREGTRGGQGRGAVAFPSGDLVRLLPSVFQGETKSAVLELQPLRYDAQRRQLGLAKRLRVKLLFTGREAGESGRGSVGRAAGPGQRGGKPLSVEVLARLFTTTRGLYAVSFEQLFPERRRALAVSELRLERQGEAVAFHVEPARDDFGPGSRLFFLAEGVAGSTDFSGEVAYELRRACDGVWMGLASAPPSGSAVAAPSIGVARFETNRFYQPGLLEAEDLWLWEGIPSGAVRVKGFTLSGLTAGGGASSASDGAGAGTAELEVFLQGASESGNPVDHHVSVSVNGVPAGAAQFAGKRPYRMSLILPVGLLREGANELSLTNVADTGVSSYVFLDRFTIAHPQSSSLAGGRFEGAWPESGSVSVQLQAGASGPIRVVDVTGTSGVGTPGPVWLTGFETTAGAVRFEVEAGHRYQVESDSALMSPRIEQPQPSGLKGAANQADWLLIAPRAFLAAAEPLVARRQDQGLTTRSVAFEEIAAEFGHGQPSAEAIRGFLSHAYQSWSHPSPRYVVLLGDASYDPRNFSGVSQPSPLPALWTKTSYLWTASDPLLGAVNGDDSLPDLAIGRLPATSVEQAQALVQKLVAWEESGQGLSGPAALVADNPDLAGDFEADVRDIAASYLADRKPSVLLLSEHGTGLRGRIAEALDGGLGYLGYVGHGGAAVWASENVWNSWNAESLRAQSTQPLLVTMNCLNGYFVAPSYDSLSESLVKAEGRGAIAAFSPSGLSLDGPAHQYHRALMAELTGGRHERLGDAVLAAQKAYAATGLMPELVSVYHLLGDPAMRIR